MSYRVLRLFAVLSLASGCPGESTPAPTPGTRAKPNEDDPKLSQSWQMAVGTSPLAAGDLGAKPDALAAKLYEKGMPGITHRISKGCADSGALRGASSVALRFSVGPHGSVGQIAADPVGDAAKCIADAFKKEAAALNELPAGDALLRLKFHPSS